MSGSTDGPDAKRRLLHGGGGQHQHQHQQQQQQQHALARSAIKVTPEQLGYGIHSWSSHSASYHPRNIAVNKPQDQSSRWSSGSNNQLQHITIKLDRMSIVHTITFGKYHKVHVCNLKEFKVFGGLTPTNMIELLHSGLRNDSEPETFSLKHKANDVLFPCLYLKIVPLLAWGANFNFSIWYVELRGICQSQTVEKVHHDYINYRENEVIRLCLKHFRQRNHLETFDSLQARTLMQLEDSLLTELHSHLVIRGDFATAEDLISRAADRNLFQDYISECSYKPVWKKISPRGPDEESPCMRGGHQMAIDTESGKVYLFGGWDGSKDLSDFWVYDPEASRWNCISLDTRRQGGPGPRSCHKICFDPKTKQVYTLGRYVDPDSRPNVNLDSDFWRFDVESSMWSRISVNTAVEGGPELIYDHQMVVDSDAQVLYVFGGRTIGPDPNQTVYSGLYAYSIESQTWRLIRTDNSQPEHSIQLKSRIGHSMLLNPATRELYIFAGQRNKDYLSDFYVYEIDTDTVHEVSRDYSKQGGPDAGFTQRATIDPDLGEFFVLSGLMREKNTTQETVKNSFWVYSIRKDRWTKVYQNENTGTAYWTSMADKEPCPRFAHQLVYDPKRKRQFLFGGNPGEMGNPNLRLDDFWELWLVRPTPQDVFRRARFHIRRQKFREMCTSSSSSSSDPLAALKYLQSDLAAAVDHSDEEESKRFRELTQFLFQRGAAGAGDTMTNARRANSERGVGGLATGLDHDGNVMNDDGYQARTELYETLLGFFPDSMREPKDNLVDLVQMK
ncbi:Muskelin 1, intracellular mediator containing kelch motif [Geranomyces michiganensis]|nr:Muskelin 1, intracellular mediator containing kelch motif [Geranomyces michiganensis]